MFIARDASGRIVNLLKESHVEGRYFICPSCEGRVQLKKGLIMRPHFAHIHLGDCSASLENESKEHLELKASLYRWASPFISVQVEMALSDSRQIADLLLGEKLILEVQCSSLSIQRLIERTQSYQNQAYQVLWLLGKKLWLRERISRLQVQLLNFSFSMGFYIWELDEENQSLRLNYLIHEDLHGRLQYKTKEFTFYEGNLLDILRYPYRQSQVKSFLGKVDSHICDYIRKQLYYHNLKWLHLQEQCYQSGDNLLNKGANDFYPQIRLIAFQDFAQIKQDLTSYYHSFFWYYGRQKASSHQVLYSPAFYLHCYEKMLKNPWC